MKPRVTTVVALACSLMACSVDHWEGGGRRQELPSDDGNQNPISGSSTDVSEGGASDGNVDTAGGAGAGGAGVDGGGTGGGGPLGGSAGTPGFPGLP